MFLLAKNLRHSKNSKIIKYHRTIFLVLFRRVDGTCTLLPKSLPIPIRVYVNIKHTCYSETIKYEPLYENFQSNMPGKLSNLDENKFM